jgi:protocatechuate 3,4-dioxygenase beta subunit
MKSHILLPRAFAGQDRRAFLRTAGLTAALFAVPGAYAAQLTRTPPQTEGPFYPDKLPLDTDNDLIIVNDALTPAAGEITWLSGRILDGRGDPIRNALVEIWQCDNSGVYLHTKSGGNVEKKDKNFQGFGRFLTGSSGDYLFRTIKPVSYPGRTPHIHFAVKLKGRKELITSVTIPFTPLKGSRAGELAAKFDIVMGLTPEHA